MDKMLEIKLLLGEHLDRIEEVKEIVECQSFKLSDIAQACCTNDGLILQQTLLVSDDFFNDLFDYTQL